MLGCYCPSIRSTRLIQENLEQIVRHEPNSSVG